MLLVVVVVKFAPVNSSEGEKKKNYSKEGKIIIIINVHSASAAGQLKHSPYPILWHGSDDVGGGGGKDACVVVIMCYNNNDSSGAISRA